MEIYSVDEAFLRLDKIGFEDTYDYARKIRETVLQHVGIPVSIGIAKTKTIAKMASLLAKKNHALSQNYVCDLRDETAKNSVLDEFPVESIWGVGRKTAWQLNFMKVHTAADLCKQDTAFLKKRFSIGMERVVLELQGTSCLSLEAVSKKQNITCSRSFGKPITELPSLLEAISAYAARACEKARLQNTKARSLCVYMHTSRFQEATYYSPSETRSLLYPSNDTCHITKLAQAMLLTMFKPHCHYRKAGIILGDLIEEKILQQDLFVQEDNDNATLMKTMDAINKRYAKQTVFLAAEGIRPDWGVKSSKKTPAYTTNWHQLKTVIL